MICDEGWHVDLNGVDFLHGFTILLLLLSALASCSSESECRSDAKCPLGDVAQVPV